jgi:Arc-like DNA binding domain
MAHCHYAELMQTPKSERVPQLADKYVLRMPDGMRDKITELAKANGRSMNAEMVFMLQQAIDARAAGLSSTGIDLDALADALAPKLALRLKEAP